jgi:hypothetical protein
VQTGDLGSGDIRRVVVDHERGLGCDAALGEEAPIDL